MKGATGNIRTEAVGLLYCGILVRCVDRSGVSKHQRRPLLASTRSEVACAFGAAEILAVRAILIEPASCMRAVCARTRAKRERLTAAVVGAHRRAALGGSANRATAAHRIVSIVRRAGLARKRFKLLARARACTAVKVWRGWRWWRGWWGVVFSNIKRREVGKHVRDDRLRRGSDGFGDVQLCGERALDQS